MTNLEFQIPVLGSSAVSMLAVAPQHLFGTWSAAVTVSLQHPASPQPKWRDLNCKMFMLILHLLSCLKFGPTVSAALHEVEHQRDGAICERDRPPCRSSYLFCQPFVVFASLQYIAPFVLLKNPLELDEHDLQGIQ